MKPTLLLLAAGMGSRYGGLKQLDGLGPNGAPFKNCDPISRASDSFSKSVLSSTTTNSHDLRLFDVGAMSAALRMSFTSSGLTCSSVNLR